MDAKNRVAPTLVAFAVLSLAVLLVYRDRRDSPAIFPNAPAHPERELAAKPAEPITRTQISPAREAPGAQERPTEEPGSPTYFEFLALHPGGGWELTQAAFDMTLLSYLDESLTELELEALYSDPETRAAWAMFRTHQALRSFIHKHANRAYASWQAHQEPLTLGNELSPVRALLDQEFGADSTAGAEIRELVDIYSAEIIDQIRAEGMRVESAGTVPSTWKLHEALLPGIEPHSESLLAAIAAIKEKRR